MPIWPLHFPRTFEVNGFSLDPVSNSTPIDVESGEPMSRRRFTGDMENIVGSLPPVEKELANEIRSFWRYDLKHGTVSFTWSDPISEEAVEFMLMAPPAFTPVSDSLWRVQLRLRKLP